MADIDPKQIADRYLDGSLTGAEHDREHQARMAAASRAPVYAAAAPRVMDREPLKDVFLGRYAVMGMRSKYGRRFQFFPQYQREGTCIGMSHAFLATCVLGVSSFLSGLKFPGRAAVAPIYAGSRVEIGKQPGTWQGSVGSWAADWLQKYGVVLLEEMGLSDDPKNSKAWLATLAKDEALALRWTNSRTGVPAEMEAFAKLRAVQHAPLVQTVAEVRAALSNLSPINLCGQVHPSQDLDSRGVSKRLTRGGGHSTGIIGMHFDGKEWWYDHLQSWWYYYKGGFCRSDNPIDKMFAGSVTRIPEKWLQSWLNERDCYALVGVQGLEPIDQSYLI